MRTNASIARTIAFDSRGQYSATNRRSGSSAAARTSPLAPPQSCAPAGSGMRLTESGRPACVTTVGAKLLRLSDLCPALTEIRHLRSGARHDGFGGRRGFDSRRPHQTGLEEAGNLPVSLRPGRRC